MAMRHAQLFLHHVKNNAQSCHVASVRCYAELGIIGGSTVLRGTTGTIQHIDMCAAPSATYAI
eukprot:100294-Karenia_brevis.AAC.1